jgi:phage portal protein BeeE
LVGADYGTSPADLCPWNPVRGVNPLASLALELEQDYYANKANSQLLKSNAIPQGVLKTEQTLRPEEADHDVLKERGNDTKPWRDVWYRSRNMIQTGKEDITP